MTLFVNARLSTQVNPSHKVYLVVPVGLLPFGLLPFCLLTPNSGVSPTLTKNDMKDTNQHGLANNIRYHTYRCWAYPVASLPKNVGRIIVYPT